MLLLFRHIGYRQGQPYAFILLNPTHPERQAFRSRPRAPNPSLSTPKHRRWCPTQDSTCLNQALNTALVYSSAGFSQRSIRNPTLSRHSPARKSMTRALRASFTQQPPIGELAVQSLFISIATFIAWLKVRDGRRFNSKHRPIKTKTRQNTEQSFSMGYDGST